MAVPAVVEVAVGGAGGDAVPNSEGATAARGDLIGPEFAVDPAKQMSEAVELAAGAVASVDHGVIEPDAVSVRPPGEDLPIHREVVVDDVQVPRRREQVESFVHVTLAERFRRCAVLRVLEAVGRG